MEHKDPSRRADWKRFLLLPIVALGLGTVIAGWKKPPREPHPSWLGSVETAKQAAYRNAKYSIASGGLWSLERPGTMHLAGFAPYTKETVTQLRPGRFLCSSSLTARSRTGALLRKRWQCLILGDERNWSCEKFQQWGWEPVAPDKKNRRKTP